MDLRNLEGYWDAQRIAMPPFLALWCVDSGGNKQFSMKQGEKTVSLRKSSCADGVLKKTTSSLGEFTKFGGRILAVSKKHSLEEQPWK